MTQAFTNSFLLAAIIHSQSELPKTGRNRRTPMEGERQTFGESPFPITASMLIYVSIRIKNRLT